LPQVAGVADEGCISWHGPCLNMRYCGCSLHHGFCLNLSKYLNAWNAVLCGVLLIWRGLNFLFFIQTSS